MPGLVLIYTGNGKGKTTAALGLCLRALGHGKRVGVLQFMKGSPEYGEVQMAKSLTGFVLHQTGRDCFVNPKEPEEVDICLAQEGLREGEKWLVEKRFDLVVFDEILVAAAYGLLAPGEVLEVLAKRAPGLDVVLTGRYAPEALIQMADTVTIMSERRHAYQRGAVAKAGMEF